MFIVSLRQLARAGIAMAVCTFSLQPEATQACSSCGCTLNSDWSSQGYSVSSGLHMDLRQDYYDQTQLRSGTDAINRDTLEIPSDEEIQQRTLNRNTVLGVDYSPSRAWALRVELPYFNRFHTTIVEGEDEISTSHSRHIGDVRVLARYQGFSPDLSWGIQFGLKLPTGKADDVFITGPEMGELVDRGLQTGTGTTDVIIGIYNFGNLGSRLGYFAQANYQRALNSHDEFKPGDGLNLNAGVRYLHAGRWTPQLQFNVRWEGRESGMESDRDNSGATLVYISSGTSLELSSSLQAYAFLQVPVYQRVNGLQLLPARFFTVGARYKF